MIKNQKIKFFKLIFFSVLFVLFFSGFFIFDAKAEYEGTILSKSDCRIENAGGVIFQTCLVEEVKTGNAVDNIIEISGRSGKVFEVRGGNVVGYVMENILAPIGNFLGGFNSSKTESKLYIFTVQRYDIKYRKPTTCPFYVGERNCRDWLLSADYNVVYDKISNGAPSDRLYKVSKTEDCSWWGLSCSTRTDFNFLADLTQDRPAPICTSWSSCSPSCGNSGSQYCTDPLEVSRTQSCSIPACPTGSIQINATLDSLPVNTTVNISTTEPVNIAFAYNKGNFNVGDTYILSASSKDLPNASVSHCAKEFNPNWSVRADYGCISPSERGYKKADGSTANNNTDSSGNWSVAGGITNDLVNTRWEEWLKIGGFESNHVFVAVSPANNGGRSYNGDRTSYKNYSENYSLPQTFGNLTLGEYKITAVSGGPAGAIFQGISPSDTQTLTSSGPGLTFTLRFKIPVPPPGSFSLSLGALSCNSVSLSWTASSGAQGYRILRNGSDITPYPYTALNFTDTTVSQNAGYSYQIEAYNAGGNTRSNTINAATPYCSPTLSFSGSLLSIFQGQSITLTWSSANTTSCTASGNPTQSNWSGSKSLNGSQNVAPLPPPNVTYTLTCSGPGGSASGSATVNISPLALPEWREIIPR